MLPVFRWQGSSFTIGIMRTAPYLTLILEGGLYG